MIYVQVPVPILLLQIETKMEDVLQMIKVGCTANPHHHTPVDKL
jgi:hypothetical protein